MFACTKHAARGVRREPRRRSQLRHLATALLLALPLAPAAQEDVPFIVTPDHVTLAMLELARVGPGDTVLDLGSGDGRIVITAARRFGARGLGVELVPELVQRSREFARRAGVADRAEFREQDLFKTDLTLASVITMYLLPEVNLQLRPALLRLAPGTRVVSHDWDMGDWPPDRTLTLDVPDKSVGLEKKSRVHLWTVPARVAGLWCAADGSRLRLAQTYQTVRGEWTRVGAPGATGHALGGRLAGRVLRLETRTPADRLQLDWHDAGHLRVVAAQGAFASLAGTGLTPAHEGACG